MQISPPSVFSALDKRILEDPNCPVKVSKESSNASGTRLSLPYSSLRHYWLDNSANYSQKVYVVTERNRATFGEARHATIALAHGLQAQYGVKKGDRVAIMMRNTVEFVLVFWATQILGAIAAPMNAFQTAEVSAKCINMIGTKFLFCDNQVWNHLQPYFDRMFKGEMYPGGTEPQPVLEQVAVVAQRDLAPAAPCSKRPWVSGPKTHPQIHDWDKLMNGWNSLGERHTTDFASISLEDPALIMFTSGTTALPKAVLSSSEQALSSLYIGLLYLVRPIFEMMNGFPPLDLMPERKTLCLVPFFHVMGMQSLVISSVLFGSTNVMIQKYTPKAATDIIQRESVTSMIGIGFMVSEIIKSGADLSSLTSYTVGGAAPPQDLPSVGKKVNDAINGVHGYGLTETNSGVMCIVGDSYPLHPNSVGVPVPIVEVRVMDAETGEFLPPGHEGELLIRSPNVARGYYNNKEATDEAFRADGYFRTGDRCKIDSEGFLYILDRIKDMVIRGGENVSCVIVEDAVMRSQQLSDAAVVGIKDERLGERIAAICVAGPGNRPSAQAIVDQAALTLPPHAVPEYVWIREEPLPRNATGKVVKATLRQELHDLVEAEKRQGTFRWTQRRARM
ncbi:hypothetical protein MVES1_002921 [Malassezia vespertilionis]|uniref:Pcs60p n=1 Tax=Malassezia vespertilionis TaxID=2020962 RepID=A0A2N1J8X7_9BASI|nr:uncharacterized protein MVES1_002921 [Malassezia vespertilionis]PKI83008.1 hypothetical protein MVES_002770 [Malassezia vespertilionis]WFD07554.1 hypothetical protein MVES1_002921 [Malassezia vespertilionis]